MRKTKLFIVIAAVLFIGGWTVPFVASAQTSQEQAIGSSLSEYQRLKDCTKIKQNPPIICLQVPIGTLDQVSGIGQYIQNFYKFFVGVIVTLAIFMIVVNGVKWLFARGNSGSIGEAKKGIGSAIGAVLLVFISVALLRIINPDLISLEVPGLKKVVTVVAPGIEWCHQVPDSMTFVNTTTGAEESAGTNGAKLSCGGAYEFFDPNDPKKTKNQCTGSACVSGGHCNKSSGTCDPAMIAGSIKADWEIPPGSTGPLPANNIAYPTALSVRVVCNLSQSSDPKQYVLLKPFATFPIESKSSQYFFFVSEREYQLSRSNTAFEGCGRNNGSYAGVGYVLQARIFDYQDFSDDDYLLTKDCFGPISTTIAPDDMNLNKNTNDWSVMVRNMFTEQEFSQVVTCNLDINRQKFPRR